MSDNLLGKVQSVDTGTITVSSDDESLLNKIQVNHVVKIRSTNSSQDIIGLISKIIRKGYDNGIEDDEPKFILENTVKINLVGTLFTKYGTERNIFKRSLNTLPSVNAECFLLDDEELSDFMSAISSSSENPLKVGRYSISETANANLDGNKFFQRHAVVVGGTGSGKSYTVANILEKTANLPYANAIVFDLHGEYAPLAESDNITLLKVAGSNDTETDTTVFLPYWLLAYDEIESLLLDRSDSNAPNQARALFDAIIDLKKNKLEENLQHDILNNFTIDSPVPYDINLVLAKLKELDEEMVPGANGRQKQGPLNGKLVRFIQRLTSKKSDKRLNFLFSDNTALQEHDWFDSLATKLLAFDGQAGIKIIDFSEVPSDILPLITGLISRLIFSIQQWTPETDRHPIAIFCDEAHLYIPALPRSSAEEKGVYNFERIAKEGRKYGVSLVVISQRPADVNKTILSQCGNFIAMRLTNPDDQNVIKRLFPDNLGSLADSLPILDVGEALIVGDSSLLPTKVLIDEPIKKPASSTIEFWDIWSNKNASGNTALIAAVNSLRKQSKS